MHVRFIIQYDESANMKKMLTDVDVKNKKVLMRVDFNVPLEGGKVKDDTRIRSTLPSINYVLDHGGSLVLMSHLGRPKGEVRKELSLRPVAEYLSILLKRTVKFADSTVGERTKAMAASLQPGEILLLENTRFDPREKKNDPQYSKELASLGDIFVNDAFGTAHRAHASTVGVAEYLPAVSGLLMAKELEALERATNDPEKPVLAIMGGAKVSDKIKVIENLMKYVNSIVIGGGMAFTFLKAKGYETGNSLLEENMVDTAKKLMYNAESRGVKIILPVDVRLAKSFNEPLIAYGIAAVIPSDQIPEDTMGLDIGPKTEEKITEEVEKANTIFWNGPMGVFEKDCYARGTMAVAEAIIKRNTMTIVGGGDSLYALNMTMEKRGLELQPKTPIHISTGGGATLDYLSGKELPGVRVLQEK